MKWLKNGTGWVWLTASMLGIALFAVFSVLLVIGWQGLFHFWPQSLVEWNPDKPQQRIIGQIYQRSSDNWQSKAEDQMWTIKVANRGYNDLDFISVPRERLQEAHYPKELAVISRLKGGDFFGRVKGVTKNAEQELELLSTNSLIALIERSSEDRDEIERLTDEIIRNKSWQIDQLRFDEQDALTNTKLTRLENEVNQAELQVEALRNSLSNSSLWVEEMGGELIAIQLINIEQVYFPNAMSTGDKLLHWLGQIGRFVSETPREANSDGGVLPAIFGTVFLVLLMSVVVMPLGVVGAIYLHEYAANNWVTKLVRVAVVNLAGVPSIVYGVFGLGFFVYTLGGSIDELLYADRLPSPTFGTSGLLWAALTLALLTLPVVIVATEEGLSRIPPSLKNGSYALGATKFETLWKLVLPIARPALLTALVLAIARAAGEVAPLMLVGVVKLAPNLPVDGEFPYLHLERKFMHLGFHIYDAGFQSTNLESARPLVYATSLLLVTVVVGLNLTAMRIRNSLRKKYQAMGLE